MNRRRRVSGRPGPEEMIRGIPLVQESFVLSKEIIIVFL